MTPEMITAAAKAASVYTRETIVTAERKRIARELRALADTTPFSPELLHAYAETLEERPTPAFIDLAQRHRVERHNTEGMR